MKENVNKDLTKEDEGLLKLLTRCDQIMMYGLDNQKETVREAWIAIKEKLCGKQIIKIEDVISSQDLQVLIYNYFAEIDMYLMNVRDYELFEEIAISVMSERWLANETKLNLQRALGECAYKKGDAQKGEALFRSFIKQNPTDEGLYYFFALLLMEHDSESKAMDIVLEGLTNAKDRESTRNLVEISADLPKNEDQIEVLNQLEREKRIVKLKESKAIHKTVGKKEIKDLSIYENANRNKPCPCGSGKKFKACCEKIIMKM